LSAKKEIEGKNKKEKESKTDGKRRVQILFFDDSDTYKNHKVNKAINLINHIIRLIFKNNKDGFALTAHSGSSGTMGPGPNTILDVSRITELQKIAKQINISIPRKFDSKASLREFFYSRDFILNVKIKMNNLLHKAILNINQIPQQFID